VAILLILSSCALPASALLSLRSLILDHRGHAIYQQREREFSSLKGFFSNDYKGFLARETSRSGWKRGQAAIVISAIAAAVAFWAARDARWRRHALLLAVCHAAISLGLLTYWLVRGVPRPWVD